MAELSKIPKVSLQKCFIYVIVIEYIPINCSNKLFTPMWRLLRLRFSSIDSRLPFNPDTSFPSIMVWESWIKRKKEAQPAGRRIFNLLGWSQSGSSACPWLRCSDVARPDAACRRSAGFTECGMQRLGSL